MNLLTPTSHYYATLEHFYLFQQKEGQLKVRVWDLSQTLLSKELFSQKQLSPIPVSQLLDKGALQELIAQLAAQKLIAPSASPRKRKVEVKEESMRLIQQTIQHYKAHIIHIDREPSSLSCPITCELFKEPVMDQHGHTFEKSAIETHMQNSTLCPLSREKITSLIPNRALERAIEELKEKEPIPTLALCKEEKKTLAAGSLEMGNTYVEEKQYEDALASYTMAFKYTKKAEDYARLPPLYEKMGDLKKATLARLHLATYQIEQQSKEAAIATIEQCSAQQPYNIEIKELLIQLHLLNHSSKKALPHLKNLKDLKPEKALPLIKKLLQSDPTQWELYPLLATCYFKPEEKEHILATGANRALQQGNKKQAEELFNQARKANSLSLIGSIPHLRQIQSQQNSEQLRAHLLDLATHFQTNNKTKPLIQTYKILYQLDKQATYITKIITAYHKENQLEKEKKWRVTHLKLLIEKQEWQEAEKCAEEQKKSIATKEEAIYIDEQLETIYHQKSNREKLKSTWERLGAAYRERKEWEKAERTYTQLAQQFPTWETLIALAETQKEQNKIAESLQNYYITSILLIAEEKPIHTLLEAMRTLDPQLKSLQPEQRIHLITQNTLMNLTKELAEEKEKNAALEKRVAQLEAKTILLKSSYPESAFGKAKWEKYFGLVPAEPPLPPDIETILSAPCPFWSGKSVRETHLLTLIPKTVNGSPLTLNLLSEIIKAPKSGHATEYCYYDDDVKRELGALPAGASYWVLMTRDVIPDSRWKSYESQKELMERCAQKSGLPYTLPKGIEAATALLMHYVESGERLYSDSPYTFTRCQERVDNNRWPQAIGGFAAGGLAVLDFSDCDLGNYGVGGVRKLGH